MRRLGISYSQVLLFLIGLVVFLHFVEVAEPPEYTEEEIQEYRDRMINILNATEGCHDSASYTTHFERYRLANDVLNNLSEDRLIIEETRSSGGFFGSPETVYCPAENLTQKIRELNGSKLAG